MKHFFSFLICCLVSLDFSFSQLKLGEGTSAPNPSAVLELESTSKGFLPPRMTTTQRNGMASPSKGMVIYNTTLACLQLYNGSNWVCLQSSVSSQYPPILTFEEILALPSPNVGDLASDNTFRCLRFFDGSRWRCTYRKPGDPSPEQLGWSGGGAGNDKGYSVAVDGSGNVYVTGRFQGSATFGSTTLVSSGEYDMFIIKYNNTGAVQWARKGGGASYDEGYGVAVDNSGNVFVTGYYYGNATFGSFNLTSSTIGEMFIVKYNSSGLEQWVSNASMNDSGAGLAIVTDATGNAYITGSFNGNATFGSTVLSSSGSSDVFIAKYNSIGVVQWAYKAGGTGSDIGKGIALDGAGSIYITGEFSGSATFGSTVLTSSGANDIFIVKYNSSGAVGWARKGGGTGNDRAGGVAVDGAGNCYVTGYFVNTAFFGSISLTSSGSTDDFVVKYTSSGAEVWGRQGNGINSNYGKAIAVDNDGHIYATGGFAGTVSFGGIVLSAVGSSDAYVVHYNADGEVVWAIKGGGATFCEGLGIAVSTSGGAYVTGFFSDSAMLGISPVVSQGGEDVLITRYK